MWLHIETHGWIDSHRDGQADRQTDEHTVGYVEKCANRNTNIIMNETQADKMTYMQIDEQINTQTEQMDGQTDR
jgi:hypothetical protein